MTLTFAYPVFLWLLWLIPVLAGIFIVSEIRSGALMEKLVAARLKHRLLGSLSPVRRRLRFALVLLALSSVIITLARPQAGFTMREVETFGREVIFAVDVSRSMLATDLQPDRITRAKLFAEDMVRLLPGDRVGLIAFAGTAFLQAPLTIDQGAVLASIRELDTGLIPHGGSNIAAAVRIAQEAFSASEVSELMLIVLSDGEELDADGVTAAREAVGKGVRIHTIGVGTAGGSVIPVLTEAGATEFVRDQQGQMVRSQLDETRLREIAGTANGQYWNLSGGLDLADAIAAEIQSMQGGNQSTETLREPVERYQWPLALAVICYLSILFISERRGGWSLGGRRVAATALCLLCFPMTGFGKASEGITLMEQEKFAEAAEVFNGLAQRRSGDAKSQFNAGTARFKNEEFDGAMEAFAAALALADDDIAASAAYNLGNTLFELGIRREDDLKGTILDLENAIDHYEHALELRPGDEQIESNKKAVEDYLEQLKQQQEQEEQEGEDGEEGEEQSEGENGDEQENGEQGDGEEQDQGGSGDQEQDDSQGGSNDQTSEPPQPEPDRDLDGDLEQEPLDPSQFSETPEGQEPQEQPDGQMTPQQASAMLEALRHEEDRVILFDTPPPDRPVAKDW